MQSVGSVNTLSDWILALFQGHLFTVPTNMKYAGYYIFILPSHSGCFRNKTIVHGECLSALPSCSFAYPWAALLSAKCQRNQAFILHGSTLHPQGNTSKLSAPHTHHHLLRNHPVFSPTHPSTDEQLHHKHVSLHYDMEKPAATATAATADLAIGTKGSEGKKKRTSDTL